MPGPHPRFRIYTRPSSYLAVLRSLLGTEDRGSFAALEKAVSEHVGAPLARCLPQARVGVYLVLRALLQPGQKVVLSPYTFHDVINMVICAGCVPVFADIDRETCNLNPSSAMSLADGDTGAILVTHLHGLATEMEPLVSFCRKRNIRLIEDAAQAFGTRLDGTHVGTFGDAGIFSFGMYKNLNTFLGGMVVTRDERLFQDISNAEASFHVQCWSDYLRKVLHGFSTDIATWPPLFRNIVCYIFRFAYLRNIWLLNRFVTVEHDISLRDRVPERFLVRMHPAAARIGLQRLPFVDTDIQARIRFAKMYHEGLQDLEELLLPPLREDGSHTYTYYPIQYRDREKLVSFAMQKGCDIAVQHLKNCAEESAFQAYSRDCPNARRTAEETIILPTYPRYTTIDVKRNIETIRQFFRV